MTPRETKLRAEVARMEAAGRPFHEVRAVVAQLCAVVARRVEKETAVQARRGAFTSPALSVPVETLKTPQGPEIGHNGQTVKGNQKMTDTPKRPARVIVAGYGQHFTNTRQKPVKPLPRIEPPKPQPDAHTLRAVPDRKKELAND